MRVTNRATDLVHAFCQFVYNWNQEDLTAMFAESPLGVQYWEDRFHEVNSSMVNLYMIADSEHKLIIVNYLVNSKYPAVFKKPPNEPSTFQRVQRVEGAKVRTRRSNRKQSDIPLKLVIDNTKKGLSTYSG